METSVVSQTNGLARVLRTFTISLMIATLGTYVGSFLPYNLFLPLSLVEIGMIIAAVAMRKKKSVSYTFLFTFTFISGTTLYPTIYYYASEIGAQTVGMVFGLTTVMFLGISVYALISKRNFSFLGSFLAVALLTMLAVMIWGIFFPLSSGSSRALGGIGVIIFSGYILYDVNRMKMNGVRDKDIPMLALNLYLDFVNLFLSLLRLLKRN